MKTAKPIKANKSIVVSRKKLEKTFNYKDTKILTYSISYPQFYSLKYYSAVKKMNLFYSKDAEKYAKYIQSKLLNMAIDDAKNSIKNGYPIHEYEIVQEFKVTYNKNCALSLYTDKYEYTGGAHGTTKRTSQTWNTQTSKQLPLKDFFPSKKNYTTDIKNEIKFQIREDIKKGNNNYFEDYGNLVEESFSAKQYYLTLKGITIYFQQYDIAPYSTGIPTFKINYGKLGLKPPACKFEKY